jgi:uncharacterized membrane protein
MPAALSYQRGGLFHFLASSIAGIATICKVIQGILREYPAILLQNVASQGEFVYNASRLE